MTRTPTLARLAIVLLIGALPLAGCHRKPPAANSIDAIDDQLVNGAATSEADPANLRSAITVDPKRAGAKPAPRADAVAATANTLSGHATGGCLDRYGASLAFANDWAGKLPPELPLPPQARLTEAAGHDGGCTVRAVSFTLPGVRSAALDWYTEKARAGGYSADRETRGGDLMLAGSKGKAAFAVIAGPQVAGATPVDVIWAKPD